MKTENWNFREWLDFLNHQINNEDVDFIESEVEWRVQEWLWEFHINVVEEKEEVKGEEDNEAIHIVDESAPLTWNFVTFNQLKPPESKSPSHRRSSHLNQIPRNFKI